MKVKELIAKLKKMPQDMEVGVGMGDNSEGEVAGWPFSVNVEDEINFDTDEKTGRQIVIITC